MNTMRMVVALALIGLALSTEATLGEDVSWIAPVSGNWSDGARWSTGTPPMAGDNVFITIDGTYEVTLTSNPTAFASLTIGRSDGMGVQTLAGNGRTIPGAGPMVIHASGTLLGGVTVALTGADPRLRIDGGVFDIGGGAAVNGGVLEYNGGTISGAGTLSTVGVQVMLLWPYENHVTWNITNSSVVSGQMLRNFGVLMDSANADSPQFLCEVINMNNGQLLCSTGNGGTNYRFEHASGLINLGTIRLGPTDNGGVVLSVTNGPLMNMGVINTANGHAMTVAAELHNLTGGVLETSPGIGTGLILSKADAHHVNRGVIRAGGGSVQITQTGSMPVFEAAHDGHLELEGNSITLTGGELLITDASEVTPFTGPWTLTLTGVHVTGNPATFNLNVNVRGNSTFDVPVTNNASMADPDCGAFPVFNGPFVNGPTGTITEVGSNCGENWTFNAGITNQGTIVMGERGCTLTSTVIENAGTIRTTGNNNGTQILAAVVHNMPTGVIEVNGDPLTINKAGAHHLNGGLIHILGSPFNVMQSGIDPVFEAADGGSVSLEGGACTITAGELRLTGSSPSLFTGPFPLTLTGVHVTGNPATFNLNVNVRGNSIFDVPVTNNASMADPDCGAFPVFNGPFVNGPTGTITEVGSNCGENWTFNAGITNQGAINMGDLSCTLTATVLHNTGTLHAFGRTQRITAALDNGPGGVIEDAGVPLIIEQTGAIHTNEGRLDANAGTITINVTGTGQFTNLSGGAVRAVGDNSRVIFMGDGAAAQGPWITNDGSFQTLGGGSAIVVNIPTNRRFLNDADGELDLSVGTFLVANGAGGSWHNGGLIRVGAGTQFQNTGSVADNFDPVSQTWTGGTMIITGPGEVCFPIANGSLHVLETVIGCIHEATTCTSAGASDLFGGLQQISDNGSFTLDNMPMSTQGDLDVGGECAVVNGAHLSVQGVINCTGQVDVQGGTVQASQLTVASGAFGGTGQYDCNVQNSGGRCQPGQSPGLLQITMNYTQGAAASLEIEIAGNTPESEYDVLAAGQAVTLSGTLDVLLLNDFVPGPGDQFIIVRSGSVGGRFQVETLPPGLYLEYREAEVRVFRPCSSDWNHSNVVSVQDLFVFLADYFAGLGDFNHSGMTTVQDIFDFLAAYFDVCQ